MPRTRIQEEGPHPIDTHVGAKVKTRRLMMGLSQEGLAQMIGLTFQQVQKYERGTNRISVGRLIDISKALRVPVDYFLDGASSLANANKKLAKGFSDNKQQLVVEPEMINKRDVMELVRSYQSIKTPALKKQLLEMAKAMASSEKA